MHEMDCYSSTVLALGHQIPQDIIDEGYTDTQHLEQNYGMNYNRCIILANINGMK